MIYVLQTYVTPADAKKLLPAFGFVDIGQDQWTVQKEEPCSTVEALDIVIKTIIENELEKIK